MSNKTRTRFVLLSLMAVLVALASAVAIPVEAAPPGPDCRFVLCAYPDCLPNEHTEIPPGRCCPVCVPD